MNMFRLFEDLWVDVCQRHVIHRTLVCQVSAILVITHADGSTGSVLVLTDQETGVHTLGLERTLHQVAETVVTDHTAERHFRTERCRIGGKDSGGTTQSKGHLFGKLLFADLRLAFYLVQNQIYIQFA